jgi:hypothetical protein
VRHASTASTDKIREFPDFLRHAKSEIFWHDVLLSSFQVFIILCYLLSSFVCVLFFFDLIFIHSLYIFNFFPREILLRMSGDDVKMETSAAAAPGPAAGNGSTRTKSALVLAAEKFVQDELKGNDAVCILVYD